MTVSELNAREANGKAEKVPENSALDENQITADPSDEGEIRRKGRKLKPSSYAPPASLRLQYEYELERSREISSSVNRLTITIPIMIAAIGLILGLVAPMCTKHMSIHLIMVVGMADIVVLLGALTVACTVHFYILNPAPSQPEEQEWLGKMKRDLQRGNNWRAWLVFAATLLIYLSVATTLALLIICILGL